MQTAGSILSTIFSIPGIQRAKGAAGQMGRFMNSFDGEEQLSYIDDYGRISPFPVRLNIQVC
jgi:hypothetical protein